MATKSMRQDQLKYVTSRADSIFQTRQEELRRKHRIPAVKLTPRQKAEALQDGRFRVDLERVSDSHYSDWYSGVIFTDERREEMSPEYHTEAKKLRDQYNKVMDELMLGDNTQALQLLRDFENET